MWRRTQEQERRERHVAPASRRGRPTQRPGGDLFGDQDAPPRLPASGEASPPQPAAERRTRPRASRARRISLAAARAEAARKTAVRSQQVPDDPQPRRAQRLDRPRARRRPFRDRGQGELDRSDAGRDLRHCAGAGAERRLLRPARPQAVRRRRRPVRRRPRARPDQGRRRARGAAAAAGIGTAS